MPTRNLDQVRDSGDVAWFAPALDLLHALHSERDDRLRAFFAAGSPLYVARAPGRLDVMGGIADYSGSLVLELPLACSTSVVLQMTNSAAIHILTRRSGSWHSFSMAAEALMRGELSEPSALAAWFGGRNDDHWAAYVIGCVQYCLSRSRSAPASGLCILIDSTVPEGKGLSSSAALEVACMMALSACCHWNVGCEEIARACQWVENHIVGAPCGVMDQMTSACGRQDRLLQLRCQPALIEDYVAVPPGYRFYGIDSGLRHAVSGADYATVRTAAFMGHRMIAQLAGSPRYLADVAPVEFAQRFEQRLPDLMSGGDFLEQYGDIDDPVTSVQPGRSYPVRQATAHPVFENDRVERFARLLGTLEDEPASAHELGQLMYESHASYGACGLGSLGTDRLVELVSEAGPGRGLFGAKITGGGSGGTVAILGTVDAEPEIHAIAGRYGEETGSPAAVSSASGPSASQTGVLKL